MIMGDFSRVPKTYPKAKLVDINKSRKAAAIIQENIDFFGSSCIIF